MVDMKRKSITTILIILAILAIAAAFILLNKTDPNDIYPEDTFLNQQNQENTLEERESFEEFERGDISPKSLDDATFYAYISEITDNLISIETSLAGSRIDEIYDSNLQMNVKAYIDNTALIKIDANDSTMRFEIYYWENEPIFILATPAEFAGQMSPDGSFIGYRMFFRENVMLQSMDLDGRPIDPDSPDFKEMEDFSSRLAFYFLQQYK